MTAAKEAAAAGDDGREPRRAALPGAVRDAARGIHQRLLTTRFGRRLALLAGGAAAGQLALLLAAPLMARLYTPGDYGAFAAVSGLVAVLAVVAGLRYEGAIPLCREDADAAALARVVVLASATFALAATVVLAVAGPGLAAALGLGGPRAVGLAWWLPPALAIQGLFLAVDGWSLYRGDVRRLAMSKVVQGIVTAAGQLAFGVLGDGSPHGLFLAYVLGQAAGILPAALGLGRDQARLLLRLDLGRMGTTGAAPRPWFDRREPADRPRCNLLCTGLPARDRCRR